MIRCFNSTSPQKNPAKPTPVHRQTFSLLFKLFLTSLLCSVCASCMHRPSNEVNHRFEFSEPQMGVPFRIVLYAPNEEKAKAAARAAFERVAELNSALSDYDIESELSQLSRKSGTRTEHPVSDDLWYLLQRSQSLAYSTDGAFDITVGPAIHLWRKARRDREFPTVVRLERVRRSMGYTNLHLVTAEQKAVLTRPDMRLDLGGIAKGFAVDEAMNVLKTNGITRALVSGGGDLAVSSPPPNRDHWRIDIASIDVSNAPPARTALLVNCALATSGDVFQNLTLDGVRYSHIVDPRTAIGLTNQSLVTIIAPDCTTADSIATTVSVLGVNQGLRLVNSLRKVDAQVAYPLENGAVVRRTRRFEKRLE